MVQHTTHLSLSQFGPDDRPSWTGDYNADMQKIDAATTKFATKDELSSISGGGGVDMQYYHSNSTTNTVQLGPWSSKPVSIKLPPLKTSIGVECTTVDTSGKLIINETGVYRIDCNFNFSDFQGRQAEEEESFSVVLADAEDAHKTNQNDIVYSIFSIPPTLSPEPARSSTDPHYVSCRLSPIVLTVETAPMKLSFYVASMNPQEGDRTMTYVGTSCAVTRLLNSIP